MTVKATEIHRTAHVDSTAELSEGVVVDAHAFVGPGCVIGAGTRLMPRAMVLRNTVLGEGNVVHPYAVLGGDPQDLKFDESKDPGRLEIGANNTFREGATLSRGAGPEGATRVGSGCYFMAGSHAGHNAKIGNRVILTNQAALAGHCWIDDGCVISAHCAIHQFVRVGRNVMMQGASVATMHIPPFAITAGMNGVAGLNRVGMRRAGLSRQEMDAIRTAHDLFYRRRARGEVLMHESLREAEQMEWPGASREFVDFVRWALTAQPPRARGLCPPGRGGVES